MKAFKKFVESYEEINEAEFNKEWWDSKSDSFKQRYIERHPNSIYAKKDGGLKGVEKNIAHKEREEDKRQREVEKDVSGNKAWRQLLAKRGLAADKKGKDFKALTPRYKKALVKGAEEVYGKDSPQAKRAQKIWGDKKANDEKRKSTSISSVSDLLKDKNSTSKDFETAATVLLDKPQNTDAWMRKVNALAEHPYTPDSVIRRMEKEQPYAALHSPKASQEFLDDQIKKLNPYDAYTWMDVLVQNPSLDTSQKETLSIKLKKALDDVNKKKWHKDSKDFYKKRLQWQIDQLLNK